MRAVTERDFRAPEFQHPDVKPEDYEFRDDGKIVRKDRWEVGLRNIASIIGWTRREYEIPEVVEQVRRLREATPTGPERCALLDELIASWRDRSDTPEARERRIQARLAVEAAWPIFPESTISHEGEGRK